MSTSLIIQYCVIAVIALAIAIILVRRIIKKRKNPCCNCGCANCSLRTSCDNASDLKKKKSYSPIAKSRK